MRLLPDQGDGRLLRTDRFVAFMADPEPTLVQTLIQRPNELDEWATLQENTTADHVIIDLHRDIVIMHGKWDVRIDGTTIPSTEHIAQASSFKQIRCGDAESKDTDTFLDSGCVPARGFTLTSNETTSTRRLHLQQGTVQLVPTNDVQPSQSRSILDDPGISLNDIGQREPQEPDRYADHSAPASSDSSQSMHGVHGHVEHIKREAEGDWRFREPPANQRNNQPPQSPIQRSSPAPTEPRRDFGAQIDFDEHGMSVVSEMLIVGRRPSPGDSAYSPDILAVDDSTVSRNHLEFRIVEKGLWVRDLNSSNGSTLRTGTGSVHDIPADDDGLLVAVGDLIEFGSLKARFAGWSGRA